MYCIPKYVVGEKETYQHKKQTGKESETDENVFGKLKDEVKEGSWSIGVSSAQLQDIMLKLNNMFIRVC